MTPDFVQAEVYFLIGIGRERAVVDERLAEAADGAGRWHLDFVLVGGDASALCFGHFELHEVGLHGDGHGADVRNGAVRLVNIMNGEFHFVDRSGTLGDVREKTVATAIRPPPSQYRGWGTGGKNRSLTVAALIGS